MCRDNKIKKRNEYGKKRKWKTGSKDDHDEIKDETRPEQGTE